jgi:hypothetical protein
MMAGVKVALADAKQRESEAWVEWSGRKTFQSARWFRRFFLNITVL